MQIKKILSFLLIAFVITSLLVVAAKGKKELELTKTVEVNQKIAEVAPAESKIEESEETSSMQKKSNNDKTIVYYFHGRYRCRACTIIENYTIEAIEQGFVDELKEGKIEIISVNVEEPENLHFVQDYQLSSRSVVVARFENSEQKDWKNLNEIWRLLGNKEQFVSYIQENTKVYLNKEKI